MTAHEIYEAEVDGSTAARQVGRILATLIGAAALIAGAFMAWVPNRTGDKITDKALVQTDFSGQGDLIKAVGGLSILIALVALVGLVDRTGWLTRLAGASALIVFVMFGVQAYRYYGRNLGTAADNLRAGAWLVLAAAVLLLIGGFLGARVVRVPTAVAASERPARRDKHHV
jgi:uncharacterized membrane protein